MVNREGRLIITLRFVQGFLMIAAITLYTLSPGWSWMAKFALPFPNWLRWLSAGVGVICIALLVWVHQVLGPNWSSRLEIKPQHLLVTTGPYRRVRHPMYAIYLTFVVATSFLASNGLVIVPSIMIVFLINERIKKEEKMMLAYFGHAYQTYMKSTGRLWPQFKQSPGNTSFR